MRTVTGTQQTGANGRGAEGGAPSLERDSGFRAADRIFSLLEVLAGAPHGLGLTAVARRAGLHKPTAYRLLTALKALGLVSQDARTAAYRPGLKLVSLADQILDSLDFRKAAHPYLEPLARAAGHSVLAGVLEEGVVVYVDLAPGTQPLRVHTRVGARRPLHVSSIGKAIVAFLPADEARAAMDACGFGRHTEHTIVDRGRFEAQLAETRERGWSVVRDEDAVGTSSVAAPVLDLALRPAGAIGVALPTMLLTPEELRRVAGRLTETCRAASADLGLQTGGAPAPEGR